MPAFAVHGDIEVGDIHFILNNPINIGNRVETGLPVTAVTNIHSAIHDWSDTDGGASISLGPQTGGAKDNDGNVNLSAYGNGGGPVSNRIRFLVRTGPNESGQMGYIGKGVFNMNIPSSGPAGGSHVCVDVVGDFYRCP